MSIFSFFNQTSHSFEGKKPYENVLLLLHRHWFVLVIRFAAFAILALFPLILYPVLLRIIPQSFDKPFLLFSALYYLFWWYGLFYAITMYLLDFWIVTDHRVIDSEQHGFFKRTTAEIHLAKIQDISVAVAGVIPTFLDFGSLEVQSAGAAEKFFFKQIPHPNTVRDTIMNAHNRFIETHPNEVEVHE